MKVKSQIQIGSGNGDKNDLQAVMQLLNGANLSRLQYTISNKFVMRAFVVGKRVLACNWRILY